ncbi:MAG: hypothetical protein C5B54_09615, partial [Acidobacteria bacterium]
MRIFAMRKQITLFILFFTLLAATTFGAIGLRKSTVAQPKKDLGVDFPQIATNTNTGDSLIIWLESTDNGGQITGRFLNASGGPKAPAFKVFADYWIYDPAIAYNPVTNQYLVVFDDRPTYAERNTFGLLLDSTGKLLAEPINISLALKQNKNWNPRIVFNPKTAGYAVAWEHVPDDGTFELVAASISKDGKVAHPVVIKQAEGDFGPHSALGCTPMDLQYHAPSGKLLVTYYAVRPDGAEDYWLATLDPLLKGKVPASASAKLSKQPISPNGNYYDGFEGASIALHDNT